MTLLHKIIEVVVTHPEHAINIDEIVKQLPEGTNRESVSTYVSGRLTNSGYVERAMGSGKFANYKILSRDPNLPIVEPSIPKEKTITEDVAGKAIVRYVLKMEEKINELSAGYSFLQSEYNKEKASNRVLIQEKNKLVVELKAKIELMRERIKRDENSKSAFTMMDSLK